MVRDGLRDAGQPHCVETWVIKALYFYPEKYDGDFAEIMSVFPESIHLIGGTR